jgi:hypothetical protein
MHWGSRRRVPIPPRLAGDDMKTGMPFTARLRAWWEGYDAATLPRQAEQKGAAPRAAGETPKIDPLAPWKTPEIRIAQLIWGSGYHKPGGPDYILDLVEPFGLDPSKSMMDFGAGLGGAARTIANEFGAWVTGYEPDVDLARAGKQMSIIGGLERKAEILRYFPTDFDLHANAFDCILTSETLFRIDGKNDLLEMLQPGLKTRGQLSITDFVLADGVTPDDPRLRELGTEPLHFWQAEQYGRRFRELSLDLRVTEDITDAYRRLVLNGWVRFARGIRRPSPMPALIQMPSSANWRPGPAASRPWKPA